MDKLHDSRRAALICAALALAVFAAYSPLWHAGFVAFDDNDYVTANGMVQHGFTRPAVAWAFSTFHAGNWHPLTWISYLFDSQFFGMNPRGFHLTNVLLHAANSVLFFLLLRRLTGALWRSALAAALFALHPLHVESVAWISERKDVLSTLFWMLAVWAYICYVEKSSAVACIASLVLFACGLMSKPMLVTLPLILLVLDYWPLRRPQPPGKLLLEKIPYFILAGVACWVTFLAQQRSGAVISLVRVPLAARLENVPMACIRYIAKTIWPAHLAMLYPYEYDWPLWKIAGAVVLLILITGGVLWRARMQPWLAAGWFWFLIMLAPVIGFIQAGPSSMADRFAYLSNAGLFIMVIWTVRNGKALVIAGVVALLGCLATTYVQAGYWTNSETLFEHTLAVTTGNSIIENDLGKILLQDSRVDDALPHLEKAVALDPRYALAHYNLGSALLAKGRVADALAQFELQVSLTPGDPIAQFNFGNTLLDHGLAEDALPHLDKAVHLRPNAADFRYAYANACRQTGHDAEAVKQYEKALKIFPDDVPAAVGLAWMLASNPDSSLRDGARAVQLAALASRLSGGSDPKTLGVLAAAQAEKGDFPAAIATAQRAAQLAQTQGQAAVAETLQAQLALYRAGSPVRDKR